MSEDVPQEESVELSALEAQLRGLPPPAPSPQLEMRLLATAAEPPLAAARLRRSIRWLVAMAAAVVVAIGLELFTAGDHSGRNGTPRPAGSDAKDTAVVLRSGQRTLLDNTSPECILPTVNSRLLRETEPCDILLFPSAL